MQNITSFVHFILTNRMAFWTMTVWSLAGSIALAVVIMMVIRMMMVRQQRERVIIPMWESGHNPVRDLEAYINWLQLMALAVFCFGWVFATRIN